MKKLLTTAATIVALGATTATAQNMPAPTFEEVAPGVWSFMMFGVNSMIVVGDDGVLVTDPSNAFRASKMLEAIRGVTDKPITHVALSHEHYDHAGGAEVFEGAEIVAQENTPEVLEMSTLFEFPEITETFEDNYSVSLGGITVDMVHLGHGDGTGTAVMHVPEADVVFSADMYAPKEFTAAAWKEDTNMLGVRAYLNKMVEWEPTYAINTHQPGNAVEALKENAELINKIHDAVYPIFANAVAEGGLGAGFPIVFSITEQVKMPEYSDWENYEAGFPNYVSRMGLSIFHGG